MGQVPYIPLPQRCWGGPGWGQAVREIGAEAVAEAGCNGLLHAVRISKQCNYAFSEIQDPMSEHFSTAVFSALADPTTRRQHLARLAQGMPPSASLPRPSTCRCPRCRATSMSWKTPGSCLRERDAQWRRCHFQREPLMEATEWIARYVAFWDGRLDALADLVESLPAREEDRSRGTRENTPPRSPPRKLPQGAR